MKRFVHFVIACIFLTNSFSAVAGAPIVDSLQQILKGTLADSTRIGALNELAWQLRNVNVDTAIVLSTQAFNLSKKINYPEGLAHSYKNLGRFVQAKGDYVQAIDDYTKALDIWEELEKTAKYSGRKSLALSRKSVILGNLANVYTLQGDYPRALECFFKIIPHFEAMNDKIKMASCYGNIGIIYTRTLEYDRALDYYGRALKLDQELSSATSENLRAEAIHGTETWLGNIGLIYSYKRDFKKALECYFKAIDICNESGDKANLATQYGNIGLCYDEMKEYGKALEYYLKALKADRELGNKNGEAVALGNIGSMLCVQKKYREAEDYLKKGIAISTEIGSLDLVRDHSRYLSELYENMHNFRESLKYYKAFVHWRDSLFNEENTKKTVRAEMNFEFEKKESAQKLDREKKDEIARAEKKRQQIVLLSVSGFGLLVLAFAVFAYYQFRQKQKANVEINHQKTLIEVKQKEILDSIHYAKRIQGSLLTSEIYIARTLKRLINSGSSSES